MARECYVSADLVTECLKVDRRQVLALTRTGKLPAQIALQAVSA